MLTREAVLAAQKLKTETVAAPGWGGDVVVSEFSSRQRFEFVAAMEEGLRKIQEQSLPDSEKDALSAALLVVRCVVTKGGKRVFTDDDIHILVEKNLETLSAVYKVAARLNGFGSAEETAGELLPRQADSSDSPSA